MTGIEKVLNMCKYPLESEITLQLTQRLQVYRGIGNPKNIAKYFTGMYLPSNF